MASSPSFGAGVDRLGTFASSACTLHCGLCAVGPGILAALGVTFLTGHAVEWGLTALAMLIASAALVYGWRTHRSLPAAVLLSLGVVGLLVARILEESHGHGIGAGLGIFSGVALIAGHVSSIRAARACRARCAQA